MSNQFPSQSHKTHDPREVAPIVKTPGRVRKAPLGRRLRENFFHGDAESAWSSMIWNSFIPGLADQVENAMHEGLSTLFGGTSTVYRRQRQQGGSGRITRHNPDRALGGGGAPSRVEVDPRDRHTASVYELDSRVEAEEVLAALNITIDQYDVVTFAEFLQLIKKTPEHTDYKFGWDDLGGTKIVSSRGSFFLDLPPVITLK